MRSLGPLVHAPSAVEKTESGDKEQEQSSTDRDAKRHRKPVG